MFNLIARRIDRIRVRAMLKSHQPSAETSGVLKRESAFERLILANLSA
jgi:hypothetical protein